ncbi:hypothetical protein GEMRC1_008914 [Eukaryota sp. GEM-RC1]
MSLFQNNTVSTFFLSAYQLSPSVRECVGHVFHTCLMFALFTLVQPQSVITNLFSLSTTLRKVKLSHSSCTLQDQQTRCLFQRLRCAVRSVDLSDFSVPDYVTIKEFYS